MTCPACTDGREHAPAEWERHYPPGPATDYLMSLVGQQDYDADVDTLTLGRSPMLVTSSPDPYGAE